MKICLQIWCGSGTASHEFWPLVTTEPFLLEGHACIQKSVRVRTTGSHASRKPLCPGVSLTSIPSLRLRVGAGPISQETQSRHLPTLPTTFPPSPPALGSLHTLICVGARGGEVGRGLCGLPCFELSAYFQNLSKTPNQFSEIQRPVMVFNILSVFLLYPPFPEEMNVHVFTNCKTVSRVILSWL